MTGVAIRMVAVPGERAARTRRDRRGVMALRVGLVLAAGLAGLVAHGVGSGAPAVSSSQRSFSSLPLTAQRAIAAQIGADDRSFWARRGAHGVVSLSRPTQRFNAVVTAHGSLSVSVPGMRVRAGRIEIGRAGALGAWNGTRTRVSRNREVVSGVGASETVVNGGAGLEQTFTVSSRPSGHGPLLISQTLAGAMPRAIAGGRRIVFGAGALSYSGLVVTDAQGRQIPARMRLVGRRLLIEVSDSQAIYPLSVDPLYTQQSGDLTASDATANELFGSAVAASGSTIVVGAPADKVGSNPQQGAVYVFTRSGSTWSQTQKLTAPDGAAQDSFGDAVSVSGSTIVVGVANHTVSGNADQGVAYVFTQSGSNWSETQELTASDGVAYARFGHSVAVSGSTIVVGATGETVNGHADQGAAYVFTLSGSTWSQTQKLTASDGAAYDGFGYSVGVSGSTLVVATPTHTVGANADEGAAYVFTLSASTWSQSQELTPSDGTTYELFGDSVSVSGSTIVVGAPLQTVGGTADVGAAYVFTQSASVWSQTAELTPQGGGDDFGASVGASGSTIVVGAPDVYGDGGYKQGTTYVFSRSGSNWLLAQRLFTADGQAEGLAGSSVAIWGPTSTIVMGAPDEAVGESPDQGVAYAFTVPVLISEVRFTGPASEGASPAGYVELANTTASPVSLHNWALAFSQGAYAADELGYIPLTGSIPAHGHYLVGDPNYAGSPLSLNPGAAADQTGSFGIADTGGVALMDSGTTVDAVGFGNAPDGDYEGTQLSVPASLPSGEFAWVRNFADGQPVNSGDDASDFQLVSTSAGSDPSADDSVLGAPGPQDSSAEVVHNDILQSSLLDPAAGEDTSPNLIYTAPTNGQPPSSTNPGTLIVNRVLTNCSATATSVPACINGPGAGSAALAATRLRFRITGLTTVGSGTGTAILDAEASGGEGELTWSGGSGSPLGLPLDAPSVAGQGGVNSTFTATSDLPGWSSTPADSAPSLGPGDSIDVEFEFEVVHAGSFEFSYNTEDDLIPAAASAPGSTPTATTPAGTTTPAAAVLSGAITASGVVTAKPTRPKTKAAKHQKKGAKHKRKKKTKAAKHKKKRG